MSTLHALMRRMLATRAAPIKRNYVTPPPPSQASRLAPDVMPSAEARHQALAAAARKKTCCF